MKELLLLLCFFCGSLITSGQNVLIEEDFDTHSAGDLVAATLGLPWTTWVNTPDPTYDTPLSNEYSASGHLSMKLSSATTNGGPTDMVLKLGNKISGIYNIQWNMYIPAGFGGYFNLQHMEVIGTGSWIMETTLRASGAIEVSQNMTFPTATYPHDEWFEVQVTVDLNTQQGYLTVAGEPVSSWSMNMNALGGAGINQLGAVNFYAAAGGDLCTYYVDDVLFEEIFTTGIPQPVTERPSIHPNPFSHGFQVEGHHGRPMILFDATGRTISEMRPASIGTVGVDTSALPSGLYFLRLGEANGEVHKLVKQ